MNEQSVLDRWYSQVVGICLSPLQDKVWHMAVLMLGGQERAEDQMRDRFQNALSPVSIP